MKKLIFLGTIVLIISGLSSCTSYNYYVAGLNRTNLSNYRTFAWMPVSKNANDNGDNNLVADAKIKDAATDALVQKGLKEMESIHTPFNTDLHEALTKVPAPSEDLKGKVIDELEKGYTLNDKVIRFAKVVVGS